ncbi:MULTISPECIES: HD domain-containing protein [Erysipelotrichaceae]|uniref:HD domain-containing protein n=1 Tax=Erysipelotrichaceae TaxID=128827 RepID=UPI000E542273|nr:HD domain-containing protein [Absiella sp. AM27-20]RHU07172.1 HD domain-containing protein [Absiella sp. AM27-20]
MIIEEQKRIRINQFLRFMEGYVPDEMLHWLRETGFFTSPASTKYHGNYEGGLFDHSFAVASELVYLTNQLNLKWNNPRSPYIVGMFHDLCKIDIYEDFIDNGKVSFRYNDKSLLKGHGDKSVIMLSQWFKLTEEEILCIRYHMGAYETDDWDKLGKSIEKYPNVLYTHTADMIASRIRGI